MSAQPVCPLCGHKVAAKERHVTITVTYSNQGIHRQELVQHVAGKCKPREEVTS